MEKYDAEYEVFDEFIRNVLANFNIRYDSEAWQALQEKLDKKPGASGGADKPSSELTNNYNSSNFDIE